VGGILGGLTSDKLIRMNYSLSFSRKLPIVVGFLVSTSIILGITTISYSSKNVGVKAFELLYEKINDEQIDVKHVELLPEFVQRETT
ncbi:hypothetical protein ACT453_21620, partial [Bacillus sp. D-CC]